MTNIKTGIIAMGILLFITPSCFYFYSPLRKAKKALKKDQCELALKFFNLTHEKNLKFVRKAAKHCHRRKAFKASLWFYEYLFLKEEDKKTSFSIKETLADIYFKDTKNYEKALESYFFLRDNSLSESKSRFYSFRIALSYFETGKWEMALKEVNMLLDKLLPEKENQSFKKNQSLSKNKTPSPTFLELIFLKARLLLMKGNYNLAEKEFRKIQKINFKFFKKNKIFFYLSFIYESRKDFHQAISELEKFKNTSDFLSDKVKRLKIRKNNQPGHSF